MKLLIASDIHGDSRCCALMLDAAKRENADKILILGDILYHGPRNDLPANYAPKAVIEQLNPWADKLLCVRGNCESEVDQMVLSFPVLSESAYFYDSGADCTMFMSHGHKYSPENLPPISGDTVFLYGHTHILGKTEVNKIPCINPGSISIPKGGNAKTYATYENRIVKIKDLDGNIIESHSI